MNTANTVSAAEYCRAISALPMPIAAEIMAAEYAARCTELTLDEWIIWRDALLRVGENAGAVEIIPPLVREYFPMHYRRLPIDYNNAIAIGMIPPNIAPDDERYYDLSKPTTRRPSSAIYRLLSIFRDMIRTIDNWLLLVSYEHRIRFVEIQLPTLMNSDYIVLKQLIVADYESHVAEGVFARDINIELELWPSHFEFLTDKGYMSANLFTGVIEPTKTMDERRDEWLEHMGIVAGERI